MAVSMTINVHIFLFIAVGLFDYMCKGSINRAKYKEKSIFFAVFCWQKLDL